MKSRLHGGWKFLAECNPETRSMRDSFFEKERDNEINSKHIGWPLNRNILPSHAILNPDKLGFFKCNNLSVELDQNNDLAHDIDNILQIQEIQEQVKDSPVKRWVSWKSRVNDCSDTRKEEQKEIRQLIDSEYSDSLNEALNGSLNGGLHDGLYGGSKVQEIDFVTEMSALMKKRNNAVDGLEIGMVLVFGLCHVAQNLVSEPSNIVSKSKKDDTVRVDLDHSSIFSQYPLRWPQKTPYSKIYKSLSWNVKDFPSNYPVNLECSMGMEVQFTLSEFVGENGKAEGEELTLYLHHLQRMSSYPEDSIGEQFRNTDLKHVLQPEFVPTNRADKPIQAQKDEEVQLVSDGYTKIMMNLFRAIGKATGASRMFLHDIASANKMINISLYNIVTGQEPYYAKYLNNLQLVISKTLKVNAKNSLETRTLSFQCFTTREFKKLQNDIFHTRVRRYYIMEVLERSIARSKKEEEKTRIQKYINTWNSLDNHGEVYVTLSDFFKYMNKHLKNNDHLNECIGLLLYNNGNPILDILEKEDHLRKSQDSQDRLHISQVHKDFLFSIHPDNSRYFSSDYFTDKDILKVRDVPKTYQDLKNITNLYLSPVYKSPKKSSESPKSPKNSPKNSPKKSPTKNSKKIISEGVSDIKTSFGKQWFQLFVVNDKETETSDTLLQNINMCADIENFSTEDGADLVAWKCNGYENKSTFKKKPFQFSVLNDSVNQWFAYDKRTKKIYNALSGKCLYVNEDNFIKQKTCKGDSWVITEDGKIVLEENESMGIEVKKPEIIEESSKSSQDKGQKRAPHNIVYYAAKLSENPTSFHFRKAPELPKKLEKPSFQDEDV